MARGKVDGVLRRGGVEASKVEAPLLTTVEPSLDRRAPLDADADHRRTGRRLWMNVTPAVAAPEPPTSVATHFWDNATDTTAKSIHFRKSCDESVYHDFTHRPGNLTRKTSIPGARRAL